MSFTIALAQIDPVLGNLPENIARHTVMAEQAARSGAQLVVFPELSLTGYSIKDMNRELAINVTRPPSTFTPLLNLSKSISILAGGIEEDSEFRIHNAAFLIEGGEIRCVHRKIYLPTYGMFEERRYFVPGTTVRSHSSRVGLVGTLICEDLWHMSLPYILAHEGAQLIIALVASPTRLAGNADDLSIASMSAEHHRAYARLLSCYIVFCNRVGFEDGVNFWGGSQVVSPDGSTIARGKHFEEDLVIAHIDENEVRRARQHSRHFLDDDPHLVLRELQRLCSVGP